TQAVSAIDGLAGFLESAATSLSEVDSSLAKAIQG
ncbi:MAG: WXG100 family type VII secretion target, partial [Actinomycetales bacterium]|nr:WXG100 family type VII secretion target [Actinomycetales bacterium]NLF05318.1 WXG100 family type VII secretion target [Actinomycetales bacterium]